MLREFCGGEGGKPSVVTVATKLWKLSNIIRFLFVLLLIFWLTKSNSNILLLLCVTFAVWSAKFLHFAPIVCSKHKFIMYDDLWILKSKTIHGFYKTFKISLTNLSAFVLIYNFFVLIIPAEQVYEVSEFRSICISYKIWAFVLHVSQGKTLFYRADNFTTSADGSWTQMTLLFHESVWFSDNSTAISATTFDLQGNLRFIYYYLCFV